MSLDDVNLPGVRLTDRLVLQAHVMGHDMDLPTLFGGDAGREDENLPRAVLLKQREFGVESKRLGIVQIHVTC